jgi:hypothetical protein
MHGEAEKRRKILDSTVSELQLQAESHGSEEHRLHFVLSRVPEFGFESWVLESLSSVGVFCFRGNNEIMGRKVVCQFYEGV